MSTYYAVCIRSTPEHGGREAIRKRVSMIGSSFYYNNTINSLRASSSIGGLLVSSELDCKRSARVALAIVMKQRISVGSGWMNA